MRTDTTVITLIISTMPIITGLRIKVTQEFCGQPIDVFTWRKVNIDILGVFNMPEKCIIDITTRSDTKICIKTDKLLNNTFCQTIKQPFSGYGKNIGKKQTCYKLNRLQVRFCDLDNSTRAVKTDGNTLTEVTVRRSYTSSSRRSRAPRSLKSGDETEQEEKERKKETIIGLSILGFFVALIIVICCYVKCPSCMLKYTPQQTHFHHQTDQGNVTERQSNHHPSTSDDSCMINVSDCNRQVDYSQDPPSYEQYLMHKTDYDKILSYKDIGKDTEVPPTDFKTKPSVQPPPYPGC